MLSIGWAASPAVVMLPPLQPEQPTDGGAAGLVKVTGPVVAGEKTAVAWSVPTTPFVIATTG